MLVNATHSGENLAHQLRRFLEAQRSEKEVKAYIKTLLEKGLGAKDATDQEIDAIAEANDTLLHAYLFADFISRRVQTGWTTHGHSGKPYR